MKHTKVTLFFILLVFPAVFWSCQDETYVEYTANSPVYMSYSDLRKSVSIETTRELVNPGKIYFKGDVLFINEYMKGIHVVDNSDPSNPVRRSFINIPGNVDIAIRGNFLYADSYIDLVVLDITDLNAPVEIDRKEAIFQYTLPEYDETYALGTIDEAKGVVVSWEITEVRERVKHEPQYYPIFWYSSMAERSMNGSADMGGGAAGGDFGTGGSMARFGQYDDYLLVLKDGSSLTTFQVENDGSVNEQQTWYAGWNIETMFIRNETMFLGAQQGMYIYDISALPACTLLSQYTHVTACDPVVADEHFAYITLREGNNCGATRNVLEVVDISNLQHPVLEKTYEMTRPHGLGIDGDVLFICDGEDGLKVYDAAAPD